jgi:UDP-glucuronate 4-epimerase
VLSLLRNGDEVVGMDNLNDYYAVQLKYDRLILTGIDATKITYGTLLRSSKYDNYRFSQLDLTDTEGLNTLFRTEQFDAVIHLAGQAGVRYSIENPFAYAQSNLIGFLNILECCRHYPVKHLVYASSSSIYGLNEKVPYSEEDKTDRPVSLYAATKKSNELMAHAYSKLYGIPTTGLRFFTVYGPWGRPDMAPSLFMKAILNDEPIKVFNHGHMKRDFTYIDDIVRGVVAITYSPTTGEVPFRIYNIGNSTPVELMHFIEVIEQVSGHKAKMHMMEMQPGDVVMTYADTSHLEHDFGYKPQTSIEEGIRNFYQWYVAYTSPKKE